MAGLDAELCEGSKWNLLMLDWIMNAGLAQCATGIIGKCQDIIGKLILERNY